MIVDLNMNKTIHYFSLAQNQEDVAEKIRGVLGLPPSESGENAANIRPKRKATKVPTIEESEDDDSFDDGHFIPEDEDEQNNETFASSSASEQEQTNTTNKRHIDVAYQAPPRLRDSCKVQQQIRRDKMKESMDSDNLSSDQTNFWKPDEQDLEDERSVFIARDFICQNNFGIAAYEMHPTSLARMKQGLEPLRKADKDFVARTAG